MRVIITNFPEKIRLKFSFSSQENHVAWGSSTFLRLVASAIVDVHTCKRTNRVRLDIAKDKLSKEGKEAVKRIKEYNEAKRKGKLLRLEEVIF